MEVVFLDDGMTLDGYIATDPGLHGELAFKYRPLFIADRTAVQQAIIREPDGRKGEILAAKKMAGQVLSWECEGGAPDVTAESVLKLHPEMNQKLFNMIMMKRAGDPKTPVEIDSDVDLEADAALANTSPEEVLAGN